MTSCTGSVRAGFWGFEKIQEVEILPLKKKVDFRSSPRPCGGCRAWCGGRWKNQHRNKLDLSPYVVKPFNSKVIKSFVPELRSRKCFFFVCVSGFLCYLYMSYEHSMYISHIRVWLCDNTMYDLQTHSFLITFLNVSRRVNACLRSLALLIWSGWVFITHQPLNVI